MSVVRKMLLTAAVLCCFVACGDEGDNSGGGFMAIDAGGAMGDALMADAGPFTGDAAILVDSGMPADATLMADAAVNIDAGDEIDSGVPSMGPFACAADPLPSIADSYISLDGTVVAIIPDMAMGGGTEVDGAQLSFINDSAVTLGTATSAFSGFFVLDWNNPMSQPVGGYIKTVHSSYLTQKLFLATPTVGSLSDIEILLMSDTAIDMIFMHVGESIDNSKGFLYVRVTDCDNNPVADAVITTVPPVGRTTYANVDPSGMITTSEVSTGSSGEALLFHAPAGEITITATVGTTVLRTKTVTVDPLSSNTYTATEIVPHGASFQ